MPPLILLLSQSFVFSVFRSCKYGGGLGRQGRDKLQINPLAQYPKYFSDKTGQVKCYRSEITFRDAQLPHGPFTGWRPNLLYLSSMTLTSTALLPKEQLSGTGKLLAMAPVALRGFRCARPSPLCSIFANRSKNWNEFCFLKYFYTEKNPSK